MFLPQRLCRFQNLFRPGANPIILCEVYPANGARGVQQKLCRPGDVLAICSGALMNNSITANRFGFGIRKESERVSGFLTKVTRDFGSIDADSNRSDTYLLELRQTLLNTPQLGVT
jgi:hypothetical protein